MNNPETKTTGLWHSTQTNKWRKHTENWKMSMDTIEKMGLTQVLANVGQHGCFTSTFLNKLCLIFVFKHSINYEINKTQEYCIFENETIWLKRWFSKICLWTLLILIWSHIFIVFSTYFTCCSYLYSNKITSILSGTFNGLHNLYNLWVSRSLLHFML